MIYDNLYQVTSFCINYAKKSVYGFIQIRIASEYLRYKNATYASDE